MVRRGKIGENRLMKKSNGKIEIKVMVRRGKSNGNQVVRQK